MDTDSKAWVEQRSCLPHAEAVTLMKCARRFERRFLVVHLAQWSHGTFGVDELEVRSEDEPQDHVDVGGYGEFESEIEAIVGALEPIEESDAVEALATWKQIRTAMNQQKIGVSTLKQHINHQELSEARSR